VENIGRLIFIIYLNVGPCEGGQNNVKCTIVPSDDNVNQSQIESLQRFGDAI
jgi:hypothetical protein